MKSWWDYSLGERLSIRALELALRPDFDTEKQKIVVDILYSFIDNPDDMDMKTICRMESLLGEELLIIPTKQQWRKIKLQRINDLYK